MEVCCLASGSSGNSYAVDDGTAALLLDAGISHREIVVGYADLFDRLSGCLITHEHKDHCRGAVRLAQSGVRVYASPGTVEAIPEGGRWIEAIDFEPHHIGGFDVLPLPADHDAAQPYLFLIRSVATGDKLLYATDTSTIRAAANGCTEMILECNYFPELLIAAEQAGRLSQALKRRIIRSHLSSETLLTYLSRCDLSKCRRLYIGHISQSHGDGKRIQRIVEQNTGIPCTILR